MRRQFFSFFMPRLHRQLYRGLCLSASMALRHSSLASRPATELKLLSLPPATHCLMVRYLVLHACSFRHCSLALTQSIRVVLTRRFSSAEDSTSGNTGGIDENSLSFPPPNVAYFVVLLRTSAWHNCKGKMQHFLLLKPQVKSDLVRGNNFWIQRELQSRFNRFVTLFYATISRTAAPDRLNIITRKLNLEIINVPKGQKQY